MSGIKYFNAGGQPLRLDDLAQILKISLDTRGITTALMDKQSKTDPFGNAQSYWLVKPTYTVDGTPGNYTYTFTNGSVITTKFNKSALCNMDMGNTGAEELYPLIHTEIYDIPHYILTGITTSAVTYWYPYLSQELETVTMYNLTNKATYNNKTLFFLPESHGYEVFNQTIQVLDWDYNLINKTYTLDTAYFVNGYNLIKPFEELIYNNVTDLIKNEHYTKDQVDNRMSDLGYLTFDLGTWNMSGTSQKTIQTQTLFNISAYDIRTVQVLIKADPDSPAASNYYPLEYTDFAASDTESAGSWLLGGTNSLILIRHQDGFFQRNGSYFDDSSINRGFITIGYIIR